VLAEQLGGLDCGGCGYSSCAHLATAILRGKASLDDCTVVGESSVTIEIDRRVIPLNTFVKKFIAGTIRGMLSSLHGGDIDRNAHVSVTLIPEQQ
jgi:Na+-translocating ferredoxin:NAD+ oxidoreductase RNF subunit RnfB